LQCWVPNMPAASSWSTSDMGIFHIPHSLGVLQMRPDKPFRLAVGSFIEDYNNRVEILTRTKPCFFGMHALCYPLHYRKPLQAVPKLKCVPSHPWPAVNQQRGSFVSMPKLTFQHPYPPTKVMFIPDKDGTQVDLLGTAGDFLRLWRVTDEGVLLERLLNNVRAAAVVAHAAQCYLVA
jgi:WD repeat-containing protein 68